MHVENPATEKLRLRLTAGTQRPLLCPRCLSFTMHERLTQGVAIDVCQLCGGVWLDPGELERLTAGGREVGASERVAAAASRGRARGDGEG